MDCVHPWIFVIQLSSGGGSKTQFCMRPELGFYTSSLGYIKCYGCGWKSDAIVDPDLHIDAVYNLSRHALRNSHVSGEDGKFICRVCAVVKDYNGLAACIPRRGVRQVRCAYGSESVRAWNW
ncbi:hypothetical protein PG996_004459 [Apiospora saccharicola]|uniref:Uncharacterized protein n=1 Tax=Apiospora saccharicola TaxID=335842 RepID=A0ABR1W7Y2_9PEZI